MAKDFPAPKLWCRECRVYIPRKYWHIHFRAIEQVNCVRMCIAVLCRGYAVCVCVCVCVCLHNTQLLHFVVFMMYAVKRSDKV